MKTNTNSRLEKLPTRTTRSKSRVADAPNVNGAVEKDAAIIAEQPQAEPSSPPPTEKATKTSKPPQSPPKHKSKTTTTTEKAKEVPETTQAKSTSQGQNKKKTGTPSKSCPNASPPKTKQQSTTPSPTASPKPSGKETQTSTPQNAEEAPDPTQPQQRTHSNSPKSGPPGSGGPSPVQHEVNNTGPLFGNNAVQWTNFTNDVQNPASVFMPTPGFVPKQQKSPTKGSGPPSSSPKSSKEKPTIEYASSGVRTLGLSQALRKEAEKKGDHSAEARKVGAAQQGNQAAQERRLGNKTTTRTDPKKKPPQRNDELPVKRKRTMRTRSIGAAKKGKKTAAPEDSTSSSSSSESSSSDSEEEPLTVEMVTSDAHFFRDEHHQRRYETYFKMRQPQKPHRFDMAYFKTIPIIFPSVFERTGWGPLLDCDQPTYTRLVRTMYASLQPLYSTDRASVHVQRSDALGYPMYTGFVCSRKFNISASMLDEKLGLGRGDDYHDFQTLLNNFPASEENMTKKFLFRSDYVIPEKRKDLNANFMKGEYRILHHCILRTICQRAGGYDYTGKPVLCLMNALLIKNIKVSAGSVMMYYIKKAMHEDIEKKGKKKKKIAFLPYGSYLLKYVREFGIELTRGGDEPMAFSLFNKHKITKMCYTLQSGVEGPDRWTRSVTGQAKAKGEASTSAQVHAYENDDSGARNLFLAPAFMQGTPAALDLPGKATKGWVGQSTSLLQRDVYRVFLEQQKQEQWLQYMTEVLWTTAARSGCKIPPPPTQLNIQIPENIKSSFAMNSSLSEPVDAVNSSGEPNPTPENEEETDN